MAEVFIGIGSNLGDRRKNISRAIEYLKKIPKVRLTRISSWVENMPEEAVGPNYLNGVIKINTEILPKDLLEILQGIENRLGRIRIYNNCPRSIDLDILLYGDKRMNEPNLTIPHPRMFGRKFVMEPLSEIMQKNELDKILRSKEDILRKV